MNEEKPKIEESESNEKKKEDGQPNIFKLLWPAYMCAFVDFLGAGIAIPILPYYMLELPWEDGTACPTCPQAPNVNITLSVGRCGEVKGCGTSIEVGLSIFFFGFGQVIGNILMSRLSDKVGRKAIIMTSLMGSALGYVWCGVATTITSLLMARLISGICGGTLPVVQAMVLDVVGDPRERAKYFGIASAMLGLGFMVGPGLGALVTFISGNKRVAFFSPVVVASICCIIGFFKIAETRPNGGICGPRKKNVDEIYEKGHQQFLAFIMKGKKKGGFGSGASGGGGGAGKKAPPSSSDGKPPTVGEFKKSGPPGGGPKKKAEGKLPAIVLACALAQLLAAFSFTCMTSMTGLVWMILFNFGPTELGIFLTGVGVISIVMNVCGVKRFIKMIGAPRTIAVACILQSIGIVGYTFITPFWIHAIFFVCTISVGFSLSLPTLLQIATPAVPPNLRGKATGIIAGSMSIGFTLCPLISGPLFQSDILRLTHDYGSFSHVMWLIGGCIGLIELAVLFKFVGCGKKLNLAGNAVQQSEGGGKNTISKYNSKTANVEMTKQNNTETV